MGFARLSTATENFNSLSNLLGTLTFLQVQLTLIYFDVSNPDTTARHSSRIVPSYDYQVRRYFIYKVYICI
jgi:hypothetical protein